MTNVIHIPRPIKAPELAGWLDISERSARDLLRTSVRDASRPDRLKAKKLGREFVTTDVWLAEYLSTPEVAEQCPASPRATSISPIGSGSTETAALPTSAGMGPAGLPSRHSLHTSDPHEAIQRLREYVDLNVRLPETARERLPVLHVLMRYHQDHVSRLASVAQNGPALDRWAAFFGESAMVAEVMDRRRRAEFRFWLEQLEYPKRHRDPKTGAIVETMHRLAPSTIRRTVEMGNAAFSWAQREGLLTRYEPMPLPPPSLPRRYAPKLSDLVKLWDAAESFRLRLFIALLVHTCGRPEAVLELTNFQCDLEDGVIHMNAEGRPQTKKTRPSIPMTLGIRPWIEAAPNGRLIQYKGKPVGP